MASRMMALAAALVAARRGHNHGPVEQDLDDEIPF